jgi:anaerobic selenocysteine-containing dehydrogenase
MAEASEQHHRTSCSRDCPDACGILATVKDGVVTGLRGDPDHPVTRGFLCYRTSRFLGLQNNPQRLRQPLLRQDGVLAPVPWEKALDVAARKLLQIREESGPMAIFHYRSGGSLGLLKLVADRFFERFGPCATKTGDICSGAGEAAQKLDFGVSDSNDLFDLENSRHIYLWGKNPFVSNVHLVPLLKAARSRGATVTLIDPIAHKGRSLADRFVQPCPGGDVWLALGVARALLDQGGFDPLAHERCDQFDEFRAFVRGRSLQDYADRCGVAPACIKEMALEFGSGPTAILVGWGLQRRALGATTVRALDALSAVSGNLFRPGGGCSFYFARRSAFDAEAVAVGESVAPRLIREPLLGQDVLAAEDPKVRAIWVTAGNPVCMLPDSRTVARAFEATEFVVVVDPLLTDTGRRADLVIPAPTLLEDDDLLGAYGHHFLAESRPVVPPPNGVLHELRLFQELARRVGLEAEMAGSVDDYKRRLLRRVAPRGVTLEALRERPRRNPDVGGVRFEAGKVPTASGRVNLLTTVPEARMPAVDPDYPLWLFSNSTKQSQASQWAPADQRQETWVLVHPDAVPGCTEGQEVSVESALGSLTATLRLDAEQRRDVAIMPKGGHYDRGHAANALIAAKATDLGLAAAYLECRVRVR